MISQRSFESRAGRHRRAGPAGSRKPRLPGALALPLLVAGALLGASSLAATPFPGPDAFGYTGVQVPFDLRDIRASGTPVFLSDDQLSDAIPLPFPFTFYGVTYNEFYISSNGFITFTFQSQGCCSGLPIPQPDGVENVVAGYWEDLNAPQGNIRYQTLGSSGSRELVVGFYGNPHFYNGPRVTFEMILHEDTDEIELQYASAPSDGGIHTVGIENATGTIGLQVARGNVSFFQQGFLLGRVPLRKVLSGGPDVDGNGVADAVVEVGRATAAMYTFTLVYNNLTGGEATVADRVPGEWNVRLLGNDGGRAAAGPSHRDDVAARSPTRIQWTPDPQAETSTLLVKATARPRPPGSRFAPTSCGTLLLNEGARATEVDPATGERRVVQSEPLCLAAVSDVNGDGILQRDGAGDEDGDGLNDYLEACGLGTNPCAADTDGDGVGDGQDRSPLDRRRS